MKECEIFKNSISYVFIKNLRRCKTVVRYIFVSPILKIKEQLQIFFFLRCFCESSPRPVSLSQQLVLQTFTQATVSYHNCHRGPERPLRIAILILWSIRSPCLMFSFVCQSRKTSCTQTGPGSVGVCSWCRGMKRPNGPLRAGAQTLLVGRLINTGLLV